VTLALGVLPLAWKMRPLRLTESVWAKAIGEMAERLLTSRTAMEVRIQDGIDRFTLILLGPGEWPPSGSDPD